MKKSEQAREILKQLSVPPAQQSKICCYTLLALAGLKARMGWCKASNDWMGIHEIIQFVKTSYNAKYAENSRETFRKQAIHHFREAAFVEDNGVATNSPDYRYRLTNEMLDLLQKYGTSEWMTSLQGFLAQHGTLQEKYSAKRNFRKIPLHVNGIDLVLSSGAHNRLQKAIIEEFAPRFAPGAECLWLGDAETKDLVNRTRLDEIGFVITVHDKMPDVVLYRQDRDWLYFIEAVTSVGPVDPKRLLEIGRMTSNVRPGKIFVTAFPNMKTYKKFSSNLAWETEVWIAEMPDHMIHLNGDRFLGPRN